jgi:hypothetical protein
VFFPDSPEITISRLSQLKANLKKRNQLSKDDSEFGDEHGASLGHRREHSRSSDVALNLPPSSKYACWTYFFFLSVFLFRYGS